MYNEVMSNERGQAMLLVVLVLAVVGVVTLSVASRTITGVRTDDISNESVKAFMAAEAGLEQALLSRSNVTPTGLDSGITYNALFTNSGSSGLITDQKISVGEGVQIITSSLPPYNSTATAIRILWNSNSALSIADYWGTNGVTYYALDSDGVRMNNFSKIAGLTGSGSLLGATFNRDYVLTLNVSSRFVRVTVLYSDTQIGIVPGGGLLPDQKVNIDATGVYNGSDEGGVVRRINYSEMKNKLPSVFDYVLYTNYDLSQ